MIVCPHCHHQNPNAATQCENCLQELPSMTKCSNCGSSVQADASFCGQCGFDLRNAPAIPVDPTAVSVATVPLGLDVPNLMPMEPLVEPDPLVAVAVGSVPSVEPAGNESTSPSVNAFEQPPMTSTPPEPPASIPTVAQVPTEVSAANSQTQLQTQVARLLHVQTNTTVELPTNLAVIHIGKPNDRIPPDIDVSGFPNSEIVSRIHADIRVEGDIYYIEDVGSSNGTYINNAPLPTGNRHRLRPGDRVALGKGDKVTFLFQLS